MKETHKDTQKMENDIEQTRRIKKTPTSKKWKITQTPVGSKKRRRPKNEKLH